MVAVAMDAERPAPAVASRNLVGRVLRQVDHLDGNVRRQIVVGGGRLRRFLQDAELLVVGERVEIHHCPSCPILAHLSPAGTRAISASPAASSNWTPGSFNEGWTMSTRLACLMQQLPGARHCRVEAIHN